MSDYTDEIDSDGLRIRLDGKHVYRKDIIDRAREHWRTSNESKAVTRSADAFVDVDIERTRERLDVLGGTPERRSELNDTR